MDIRKNFLCGIVALFLFADLMADPITIPTDCEDISCTIELCDTPELFESKIPWERLGFHSDILDRAKVFAIKNFVVAKINVENTSNSEGFSVLLSGLDYCASRFNKEAEYAELSVEDQFLLGLSRAFENRLVPVFNIEFNCFVSVSGKICDSGQTLNGFLFIPRDKLGAVTERITQGKILLSCENLERVSPLHNVEHLLPLFAGD